MKTYTSIYNQSLLDIAEQKYGNIDATLELAGLNDFTGKMLNPSTPLEVDFAYPVQTGTVINYDETSALVNQVVLAGLGDTIITTGLRRPRLFSKKFNKKFA